MDEEHAPEQVSGSLSFFGRRRQEEIPDAIGVDLKPGFLLGDFRLIRSIGQGGMGQVWEAEQLSLRRSVALKLVRPDRVTRHSLDLFAREARAGGRLQHPGLVAVHAHGESHDLAWIAMELVPGSWTLRDFIEEMQRTDELPSEYYSNVARFVAELAGAVQIAHDAGVIHRDLKPQNILITPDSHPKVTDFGLAKIAGETALSVTGDFAGTYYYMSPEQATARRMGIDHRTDVFSLGVVLYELLALRRPFEGDTAVQVAEKIVTWDPPEIRKIRSRVPSDLAVICGKALEKQRDRRFQSMGELASDLRRHLQNEPIAARPPSAWDRTVKWSRRNPAVSAAGAVAGVGLLAVSALLAQNLQTNQELTTEKTKLARANGDLERTNDQLAEQTRAAEAAAAEEKRRADEVMRLSAIQDYEDLITQAEELWPAHPENVAAYEAWIATARGLLDDLPQHYAQREALRAKALPRSEDERRAERRSHPEFPRLAQLEGRIEAARRALAQRRDGVSCELPALRPEERMLGPAEQDRLAWFLVDPERTTFGEEHRGLALALAAIEKAEETGEQVFLPDVWLSVAWGNFALGRDEAAREAIREAVKAADEESRPPYEHFVEEIDEYTATARSAEGLRAAEQVLEGLPAELAALDQRLDERRDWHFPPGEEDARWWHANLNKLIVSLEDLHREETGLLSEAPTAMVPGRSWSVPRRLAFAERLRDGFAVGGAFLDRWQEATAAIREHEVYGRLELSPQMGLVPIGPDPTSGLWEFWHVATGDEPQRGGDGRIALTEEAGVILVLVPGGSFAMGAQSEDPSGPNYDPQAKENERPVHDVSLSPYFLSKYELTQGQWSRMTGHNPSYYKQPSVLELSLLHPVEQIRWTDALRELSRMDLSLPSEAQWERACRAGTDTPWWTGSERESLRERGAANLADETAARFGVVPWSSSVTWPELNDGYAAHAPVGTYAANAYGMHDLHGNVWEWCLDGFDWWFYDRSLPEKDPVAPRKGNANRVARGGSFGHSAAHARSANRLNGSATYADDRSGIRPARVVVE